MLHASQHSNKKCFSLEVRFSHSPFIFYFSSSLCLALTNSFNLCFIWFLVLLHLLFHFSPQQKLKLMFGLFSQCLWAALPTLSLTHTPDTGGFPNRLALPGPSSLPHTPLLLFPADLLFSCSLWTSSLCSFPSSGDKCQGWLRCSSLAGLAHPPFPAWFTQMSQSNVYETLVLQLPWQQVKRHWCYIIKWIRQEKDIKRESYYFYTDIRVTSKDENTHGWQSLYVISIAFGYSPVGTGSSRNAPLLLTRPHTQLGGVPGRDASHAGRTVKKQLTWVTMKAAESDWAWGVPQPEPGWGSMREVFCWTLWLSYFTISGSEGFVSIWSVCWSWWREFSLLRHHP